MNKDFINRETRFFEDLLKQEDLYSALEDRIIFLINEGWNQADLEAALTPLLTGEESELEETVLDLLNRVVGFTVENRRFFLE